MRVAESIDARERSKVSEVRCLTTMESLSVHSVDPLIEDLMNSDLLVFESLAGLVCFFLLVDFHCFVPLPQIPVNVVNRVFTVYPCLSEVL